MGCGASKSRSTIILHNHLKSETSFASKQPEKIPKHRSRFSEISKNAYMDNDLSSSVSSTPLKSADKMNTQLKEMTIIHFNDVYNIEQRDQEPVGGAARFVTKVREFDERQPLILFSGDCLNPSLMSTVTKGKQMVPTLNAIGVHAALYGNHDFDFGVDELLEFKSETNFPWLLSNVIDNITGEFLASGIESLLMPWHGRKVGIFGLIEEEWLVTLSTVDPRDVTYFDFVEVGRRLARELREKGADLVIALTHMRTFNDKRLLSSDVDVDLILGGHDHYYEIHQENGKTLVKSGTDFREFSTISVYFDDNSDKPSVKVQKIEITSDISEDGRMKMKTDEFLELIKEKMDMDLGNIPVELDGRFSVVRTMESNLGNFISDIMRMAMQVDAAILNGGSLRSDRIHPAGPFTLKDLVSILPMMDTLVVLAVTGEKLVEALENGVSQYPKHEGRFPQVSGISFSFNPRQPSGQRIVPNSVKVNGQFLDWKQEYSVCVKLYLANGKDGYDMFKTCRRLVNEENGQILPTIVQNHFESLKIISGMKTSLSGHRQSVLMSQDIGIPKIIENERCKLSPKVEGRINLVDYDKEKEVVLSRPLSPKPRGRISRIKSVTAPSASLMGLTESPEEFRQLEPTERS